MKPQRHATDLELSITTSHKLHHAEPVTQHHTEAQTRKLANLIKPVYSILEDIFLKIPGFEQSPKFLWLTAGLLHMNSSMLKGLSPNNIEV